MSSITKTNRLGLSLSGGGYRATAFHLGTLKKLQAMNLLRKVDIISTISGSSITAAYYCLHKDNYSAFEKSLYEKLQMKKVIKKVILSRTFLQLIVVTLVFLFPAFYFLFTNPAWLFVIILVLFYSAVNC